MVDEDYTLEIPTSHGVLCHFDRESKLFVMRQCAGGEWSTVELGALEVQELCRHLPSVLVAMREA